MHYHELFKTDIEATFNLIAASNSLRPDFRALQAFIIIIIIIIIITD